MRIFIRFDVLAAIILFSTIQSNIGKYLLVDIGGGERIVSILSAKPHEILNAKNVSKLYEHRMASGVESGQCETTPELVQNDNMYTYTCKRKDQDDKGNYILGKKNNNRFNIDHVNTKYCQPKADGCSCSKLFDSLLLKKQFQDISLIHLLLSVKKEDYIAACKCYLGSSARAGFDSVEITYASPASCNGKKPITTGSYAAVCEIDLAPNVCAGRWDITKTLF